MSLRPCFMCNNQPKQVIKENEVYIPYTKTSIQEFTKTLITSQTLQIREWMFTVSFK